MAAPAQHAARGASSAERWMACPGSIKLSEGMPNESSVYAREGSCAHLVASTALTDGNDANFYDGVVFKEYPEFEVDGEMTDAVQIYLDTIRAEIDAYTAAGHWDFELDVEVKFDLTHVYADMFGTCDAALYLPAWKKLIVFDYKHGYVGVPVEKNKQTMYYGLGALTGKHNRAIEHIQLVIVQPNSLGEAVKRWDCDVMEMLDFATDLKNAAAETDKKDAALNPGEWCKYCPASPKCKALEAFVTEKAMAEFGVADDIVPTPAEVMTPSQLKLAWENASIIEAWAKNVKSYAHQQAIAGAVLPGLKLVNGKSYRRWKEGAEEALNTKVSMGELTVDLYEPPKLKTPAKLEKALGKDKDLIESLWEKGIGSLSLVPESDKRPAAKITAEDEFSGVGTF